MEQDKVMLLQREEDLKDTIENELIKQNRKDEQIEIKNIKPIGQITSKDKINGKEIKEDVFLVDIEIKGKDGKIEQKMERCYLGDKCIGGKTKDTEMLYADSFKNSEPEKMKAINELLERTSKKEMEDLSLNTLKKEEKNELQSVLSAYLGKEVPKEEVEKTINGMDKSEVEQLKDEKKKEEDGKDVKLSKEKTEKVSINALQEVNLEQKVDGKESLGMRLDLPEYDKLYVIYTDKVNDVTPNSKMNNTRYALVGVKKDGTAQVLNEEFKMDDSIGNCSNVEQTKIKANSTATRDNKTISNYVRTSNNVSIGIERESLGNIDLYMNQKTRDENENVGIQIETSQTPRIPIETRNVMNRNKGTYQKENVQDEIEEHTDAGCNPNDVKDYDGNIYTETHEHPETTKENIQEEKDKQLNNGENSKQNEEDKENRNEKTEEEEMEELEEEDPQYAAFINRGRRG